MNSNALLDFIKQTGRPVSKRDIVTHFGIKGAERIPLKRLLKQMVAEGTLLQTSSQMYISADNDDAPKTSVLEVAGITVDGDLFAIPAHDEKSPALRNAHIELVGTENMRSAPGVGDRILAEIKKIDDSNFEAKVLRILGQPKARIVGRIQKHKKRWIIESANRKDKHDFELATHLLDEIKMSEDDLSDGLLVEVQPLPDQVRSGLKRAKLVRVIGNEDDRRAISRIAAAQYGLPFEFPKDVVDETAPMKVPNLGKRKDYRKIPLVTIDGADARDFDDAVYAEADTDPRNEGGYNLIVAIADVAYYVQVGTRLDTEAFKRGNSTYFPDLVLPMLPEKLSNDLCSLRPDGERACMVMEMKIDRNGKLISKSIHRGLMHSAARLIYEQVQAAIEGVTDELTGPLVDPVIKPLYEAFAILDKARQKRGALEIDMPEKRIVIDDDGHMSGLATRERLDAHKLIEEFMILANVAAAELLQAKDALCMYRIHDKPSADRLEAASTFLEGFGLSLPKGQVVKPHSLNNILSRAKDMDYAPVVNEVILRSQSQAVYSVENIGHFGLALQNYAHFTSPIRRYSDLVVHRSLIKAYGLGEGGLDEGQAVRGPEIADHISKTERTSMEAERSAVDKYTAAFLSDKVGLEMSGRISGLSRFGLFVKLDESGADGIVPIRSLPDDYYIHDEQAHALIGRKKRLVFRLSARVTVRIADTDPLTGSATFELLDAQRGADIAGFKGPEKIRRARRQEGRRKNASPPKGKPNKYKKKTTPKHKRRKNNKPQS